MLTIYGLRRTWRFSRTLLPLLIGVAMACALFASAPLYSRAVAELGLRHALVTEPHHRINLQILARSPLSEEAWRVTQAELGGLIEGRVNVAYTEARYAYRYHSRRPPSSKEQRPGRVRFYAFSQLLDHVAVVKGRLPHQVPLLFPAVGGWPEEPWPSPTGRAYHPSSVDLEGLVTTEVADTMGLRPGDRFRAGRSSRRTIAVRIAGIVEPLDADEPYWMSQPQPLHGAWVETGQDIRYHGSILVVTEDFEAPFGRLRPDTFGWYVLLDRDRIRAETMDQVRRQILRLAEGLAQQMPGAQVVTGLHNILASFSAQLARIEGPVSLLLLGLLTLALYYLVTTAGLVLEQQAADWAVLSSRGASSGQMILLHALTVVVLCLIGFVMGPPLAQMGLAMMMRVGPLAALAVARSVAVVPPGSVWRYSAAAATLAGLVLLLPAFPAARRTIVTLRQSAARPPRMPAWTRYYLDLALLAAGAGLLWRLRVYGGLRTATIAGISGIDPLHLAAPALLLTGGALLWLRLFPLAAQLLAAVSARRRGLVLPLALWGVGRDPGYYAHLVLLLLGAVSLGTFAAVLEATRDHSAWEQAMFNVGASVRAELSSHADPLGTNWEALPGVTQAMPAFRGASDAPYRAGRADVLGVDPVLLPAVSPVPARLMAPLAEDRFELGGLPLPAEAQSLELWLFQRGAREETRLTLTAHLGDAGGYYETVVLHPSEVATDRWVQWAGPMPETSPERGPWHLLTLVLRSKQEQTYLHHGTVFLDDVGVLTGDGVLRVLEDFEEGVGAWSSSDAGDPWAFAPLGPTTEVVHRGQMALQMDYAAVRWRGGDTFGLWPHRLRLPPIQAWVSPNLARRRRVAPGDVFTLPVGWPSGGSRPVIHFKVVGLLASFPTLGGREDLFLVCNRDRLLPALNAQSPQPFQPNEVWLSTEGVRPPPALLSALSTGRYGVRQVTTAAELRDAYRREPLPNAVAGALFAGFWAALGLSLAGFAFYLGLTARRRSVSFAVLRALGWSGGHLGRLLAVEGVALSLPALLVGMALGLGLSALARPFLGPGEGTGLVLPWRSLAGLTVGLGIGFTLLLWGLASWLRLTSVEGPLRWGEE